MSLLTSSSSPPLVQLDNYHLHLLVPTRQKVQVIHFLPGVAGQLLLEVEPLLDHLVGGQHPQRQHLESQHFHLSKEVFKETSPDEAQYCKCCHSA